MARLRTRCTATKASSKWSTRLIASSTTSLMRFPDREPLQTVMTVTFAATPDGKTLPTLLDAGYPSQERRDFHERGWPAFLDAFERTLAGGERS